LRAELILEPGKLAQVLDALGRRVSVPMAQAEEEEEVP
jgi:hypothetical protein